MPTSPASPIPPPALAKARRRCAAGGGQTFGAMLKEALNAVTEAGHKSDAQTQAMAAGKADMVDVVTAVSETEVAVETMVSVRDKVIAAYKTSCRCRSDPILKAARGRGTQLEQEDDMTGPEVLDVARDAIVTLVLVSSPLMLIGLVVGVVISLFQALTQIQEMTLVFVPKILAIFVAMLLALPFMADLLHGHMMRIAARIAAE